MMQCEDALHETSPAQAPSDLAAGSESPDCKRTLTDLKKPGCLGINLIVHT